MYQSLSGNYEPIRTEISHKNNVFPPANINEIEFPETRNGGSRFQQPPENSKNMNWKLIGYVTSNKDHNAYKLYERYNQSTYQYEYLVLLENNVFVKLEPRDNRIKNNTVIPDGSIPSKNGLGDYHVNLY